MAFFTQAEVYQFKEQGFVRKSPVVARQLLDRAADRFYDELPVDQSDPTSFVGVEHVTNLSVGSHPDVQATLSESPIQQMCEELAGDAIEIEAHTFAKPIFPTGRPASEWSHPEFGHLDGYAKSGVVKTFTIAVTVNINDVQPRSGAFTVWPGTHRRAHEYFRNHPLADGMKAFRADDGSLIDLPEPIENPGPAGSMVFWHSLLMHSAGNNYGTDIRMVCVSRFKRTGIEEIKLGFPADMWEYWPI